MVKFGVKTVKEAMEMGRDAANYVSEFFMKPIKLEFEKVYYPYLLFNRKRYAGLYWTKESTWDKIDTKGIESVRRDNCALIRNMITTILDMILV
jgi:DNA polymerase delta subunit 1